MPISIRLFALAIIVFLLQLFPYTGVFLMMVAAPFWSVVLINGGFVAMAYDAWSGRAPVIFFLGPFIWFGGYGLFALKTNLDIEEAPPAIRIGGAPLLVTGNYAQETIADLLKNYGLSAAYTKEPRAQSLHTVYRLTDGPSCNKIKNQPGLSKERQYSPTACVFGAPAEPPQNIVQLDAEQNKTRPFSAEKYHRVYEITGTGEPIRITSSGRERYPWFPIPVMGCTLISSGPSWECVADFMRDGFGRNENIRSMSSRLGAALGLREIKAVGAAFDPEFYSPPPPTPEAAKKLAEQKAAQDLRSRNPTVLQQPAALAREADPIIALAKERIGQMTSERNEGAVIPTQMIARMDDAGFRRAAGEIVPLLLENRHTTAKSAHEDFWLRLADLGPEALPLFERVTFNGEGGFLFGTSRRYQLAPLRGLCRMGPAAAPLADDIAAVLEYGANYWSTQDRAAITALVRMGRTDLVWASFREQDYAAIKPPPVNIGPEECRRDWQAENREKTRIKQERDARAAERALATPNCPPGAKSCVSTAIERPKP